MNWRKWLDEFVLAGKGILLATHEKRFWYGFIPAFLLFGLLMNLLSGGFSTFELMGAVGFPDCLSIIWKPFLPRLAPSICYFHHAGHLNWFHRSPLG